MVLIDSYRIVTEENGYTTVQFLNKKKEVEFEFTLDSVLKEYITEYLNKEVVE